MTRNWGVLLSRLLKRLALPYSARQVMRAQPVHYLARRATAACEAVRVLSAAAVWFEMSVEFDQKAIDYALSDQIENLDDLVGHDLAEAKAFFDKTYVTAGMRTLLRQGMQRLAGISGQAVFELTCRAAQTRDTGETGPFAPHRRRHTPDPGRGFAADVRQLGAADLGRLRCRIP